MAATASSDIYNPDRSRSDNATQFEFAWVPQPIILRLCAMDLFKARQREKRNMTARRVPPPWSIESQQSRRPHENRRLCLDASRAALVRANTDSQGGSNRSRVPPGPTGKA